VVKPADDVVLVGEDVRLEARICNEKGRKCKLADNAKWSVSKKAVAGIAPKRGSETIVTGESKVIANVTAKQAGLTGKARIKVNAPPPTAEPSEAPTTAEPELSLHFDPEEATFEIGQTFVLTTLGYAALSANSPELDFIQNSGRAGGCEVLDILALNADTEAGLELLDIHEHAALLLVSSFAGPTDASAQFIGPAVTTEIGGSAPSLFSANIEYAGPKLGDFDMDGDVDVDDLLVHFPDGIALDGPPIPAQGDLSEADLSKDGFVTGVDVDIQAALILHDSGGAAADAEVAPITEESSDS
jgi:hypothetical protein